MSIAHLSPGFNALPPADNPVTVIDCTGANLTAVRPPAGTQMAGYLTGSGGVAWTDSQFALFPGTVLIDQSPVNTPADETADVYDLESRAGTLAELSEWARDATASYVAGKRPGQRSPCVYQSLSNVTSTVNQLLASGITGGISLWVAGTMDQVAAEHLITSANGPFPIVGVQYAFQSLFDVSVFSSRWLNTVSRAPAPPKPQPGTQTGWKFCHKCQGLFYGPGIADSACPRGGGHDDQNSHSYTLGFDW